MSDFDAFDAAVSAACVGLFGGDAAVLSPRLSAQYVARVADPDRPARSVVGIFSSGSAEEVIRGQVKGAKFKGATRDRVEPSSFWMAADQVAALGYGVAIGDALTLTGRPGSPTYAVVAPEGSNEGDLNLILVIEDAPT
jgi:hypothetical protein